MVAEQSHCSGTHSLATSFCPSCQVTTTTVTTTRTITSSSGEKEKNHWSSKLQEEPDIKMFSSDPKLNPRLPSPTSFDGVKPSYVEWSEEILTFLSVTDYQEFVPILQAVTGHKDVITKKVFIEGVLSEIVEEIKEKNTELEEVTSGARIVRRNGKNQGGDQSRRKEGIKGAQLIKADNFLRYVLLHSTSGDPNVMVRRIMRTTSSDSEVVTGLEIWRQMAVTYAGSAQTRVVTLLKQIMTPSEWNPEKSSNVLQLYQVGTHQQVSLSSEKIAPSIKITLALQNVRGPLANALSISITEKSTWNDIHSLLINYFNNSITSDSKEIYQFDISGKVSKEDSVNQVGKKGKGKSKKSKGQSKGKGSFRISLRRARGSQRDNQKERQNQKEKVNGPHGQVNLGHGIRIRVKVKVGKEKERDIKYVLIVVVKVIQLINVGGLRKLVLQGTVQIKDKCTISQLSLGIIPSLSCPQISSEVFRISDPFINSNLTINHTTHNHLHHQRCPQSLPLAKVKDSVDIIFTSIISHQMSQKTTSWRSTSAIPSMTLAHHCLRNVKNLGQHS